VSPESAVAVAAILETPLKFRAPGVTLAIGLGIGRLVFRALNACELVLAVAVVVALVVEPPPALARIAAGVAVLALIIQVLAVRPRLTKRSETVLAGGEGPRSRAHFGYVGFEIVKVVALLGAGLGLLTP
jgi:hypothetical protein